MDGTVAQPRALARPGSWQTSAGQAIAPVPHGCLGEGQGEKPLPPVAHEEAILSSGCGVVGGILLSFG